MMLGLLLSVFLLSISCFSCQVQHSHIYTLNASQAQAGTQSGPATAEITVQSPSVRTLPYSCPCPPSSHDDIVTSDIRSSQHPLSLCCATLLCTVAWGQRKEASRISGRDIGKYRASLDWPAESWLSIEQEDCIMRYFDTIGDKIAVYRQRVNHSVTANALSNVMQWYGWSSDDGWNCSSSSARHWTRCVMLSVDFVASRLCCNINQLLLSIITTLLPKLDDPTYQVKTQESF